MAIFHLHCWRQYASVHQLLGIIPSRERAVAHRSCLWASCRHLEGHHGQKMVDNLGLRTLTQSTGTLWPAGWKRLKCKFQTMDQALVMETMPVTQETLEIQPLSSETHRNWTWTNFLWWTAPSTFKCLLISNALVQADLQPMESLPVRQGITHLRLATLQERGEV